MPDDPLRVQFGGNAAFVFCDDRALRQLLHRHFHHCLGDTAPAVVTYQVTAEEDQVQLLRDGESLYRGPRSPHLVERLMQELTAALTAHCRQHLVFHAAGLAHGQRGLILCGGTGSGKSTLAAWLTATGLDFLSDELVAVSLDLSEMSGLTRPIGLKAGSAFVWQRWLDETDRQSLTHSSSGTVLLDPEQLRLHCVRASAHPQALLFPRYVTGEPFMAQRLSTAEALFHLMQRLINAKNLPGHGLEAATRLAQQTTAYSLTYADVTQVADWIEQSGWFSAIAKTPEL